MKKSLTKKQRELRYLYRVVSYSLVVPGLIILGPLVGFLLGRQLDQWLGSEPWLQVLGILLGFAAGVREALEIARKVLNMRE